MELRDGWGNAVMRMLGIVQEDQLHVKLEELTTYRALGGEWSVHDHCHRLFQEMEAIRLERARYGLGAHGFVSLHARTPFFFNWSTKLIRELFCRYPIGI
jgi:hypothetical protein